MTKFIQILLLVVGVQWFEANGTPIFQGISFQRGFELNFKPIPRKPISFIMEKWSPFGKYGTKHAIQKRSEDGILVPVEQVDSVLVDQPAAPVFEHVDEMHMATTPLRILPIRPPGSVRPPPPLIQPIPVSPAPLPVSSPEFSSVPYKPVASYIPLPPPAEVGTPPIASNIVVPPPRVVSGDRLPPPGLFTDISRAETPVVVEENIVPPVITNNVTPEPPIVVNENSLIRGSKLALYFGNIFLQLMSQFLTNARATFDQMTNPPPIYNN